MFLTTPHTPTIPLVKPWNSPQYPIFTNPLKETSLMDGPKTYISKAKKWGIFRNSFQAQVWTHTAMPDENGNLSK